MKFEMEGDDDGGESAEQRVDIIVCGHETVKQMMRNLRESRTNWLSIHAS